MQLMRNYSGVIGTFPLWYTKLFRYFFTYSKHCIFWSNTVSSHTFLMSPWSLKYIASSTSKNNHDQGRILISRREVVDVASQYEIGATYGYYTSNIASNKNCQSQILDVWSQDVDWKRYYWDWYLYSSNITSAIHEVIQQFPKLTLKNVAALLHQTLKNPHVSVGFCILSMIGNYYYETSFNFGNWGSWQSTSTYRAKLYMSSLSSTFLTPWVATFPFFCLPKLRANLICM